MLLSILIYSKAFKSSLEVKRHDRGLLVASISCLLEILLAVHIYVTYFLHQAIVIYGSKVKRGTSMDQVNMVA